VRVLSNEGFVSETEASVLVAPIESGSPKVRAIRELRRWIHGGALANDEQLPSVRALAERLGVSRSTVQTALRQLEAEGALARVGAGGRVVSSGSSPALLSLVSKTIAVLGEFTPTISPTGQGATGLDQYIQI